MSSSTAKRSIIFFGGYKTPIKRYISYFPGFELCSVTECNYCSGLSSNILTHSIGLVNALIYFSEQNIKPTYIIAMDPPNLFHDNISKKIQGDDKTLSAIYQQYRDTNINLSDWNITVFRNISKKDDKDTGVYSGVRYYTQDTHYPYQIQAVRNSIVSMLTYS